MLFAVLLAVQALSSEQLRLQRALLDAARRQLEERDAAALSARLRRDLAAAGFKGCVKEKLHPYQLDDCNALYEAVERAAVDAEVAYMGVRFERANVEKYLATTIKEAAEGAARR